MHRKRTYSCTQELRVISPKTYKVFEIMNVILGKKGKAEEILDEDNLIIVLEDSKKTSKEINERMEQSLTVEEEINQPRNQYRSVAVRGSILYFVIADLARVDPMYQYSLAYFTKLFNVCIDKSQAADALCEGRPVLPGRCASRRVL